jgi:hypothetical protein
VGASAAVGVERCRYARGTAEARASRMLLPCPGVIVANSAWFIFIYKLICIVKAIGSTVVYTRCPQVLDCCPEDVVLSVQLLIVFVQLVHFA